MKHPAEALQNLQIFFLQVFEPLSIVKGKKVGKAPLNHRYKIRTFESAEGDGSLVAGTVVVPLERSFALYAPSLDDAEGLLCEDVRQGTLMAGRVYQICPRIGNPEIIRSVAICEKALASRVLLDASHGMSSEFRRIRYPQERAAVETRALELEGMPA